MRLPPGADRVRCRSDRPGHGERHATPSSERMRLGDWVMGVLQQAGPSSIRGSIRGAIEANVRGGSTSRELTHHRLDIATKRCMLGAAVAWRGTPDRFVNRVSRGLCKGPGDLTAVSRALRTPGRPTGRHRAAGEAYSGAWRPHRDHRRPSGRPGPAGAPGGIWRPPTRTWTRTWIRTWIRHASRSSVAGLKAFHRGIAGGISHPRHGGLGPLSGCRSSMINCRVCPDIP